MRDSSKISYYSWQERQWQEICRWRQQDRLPHALLLLGHRGLGQRHFAHIVAQALLCERGEEWPCQVCRSCQLFAAGNHPDFFNIEPENELYKTLKIDQIRSLMVDIQQSAHTSDRQIVIINPAEGMNLATANAFLKTLEEPPGSVLFILLSAQLGCLLPTLVSRCHQLTFKAENHDAIILWMQEQMGIPADQAKQALALAHGIPLLAIEFEKSNYLSLCDRLLRQLMTPHQNPILAAQSFANDLKSELWQALSSLLLDLLRLQLKVTHPLAHENQRLLLQSLAKRLSPSLLLPLLQRCQENWMNIEKGVAVNATLLLENIFLAIGES
jgi:DNA polymerase-3 subunit delta'